MCVCHNKTNGYYVYQLFIVLNIFLIVFGFLSLGTNHCCSCGCINMIDLSSLILNTSYDPTKRMFSTNYKILGLGGKGYL